MRIVGLTFPKNSAPEEVKKPTAEPAEAPDTSAEKPEKKPHGKQ